MAMRALAAWFPPRHPPPNLLIGFQTGCKSLWLKKQVSRDALGQCVSQSSAARELGEQGLTGLGSAFSSNKCGVPFEGSPCSPGCLVLGHVPVLARCLAQG